MALFARKKPVDKFVRELLKQRKSHVDILHELLEKKYSADEIARATKILSIEESRTGEGLAQRTSIRTVPPQPTSQKPQQRSVLDQLNRFLVGYQNKHDVLEAAVRADQVRRSVSAANKRKDLQDATSRFDAFLNTINLNKDTVAAELNEVLEQLKKLKRYAQWSATGRLAEGIAKQFQAWAKRNEALNAQWLLPPKKVRDMVQTIDNFTFEFSTFEQPAGDDDLLDKATALEVLLGRVGQIFAAMVQVEVKMQSVSAEKTTQVIALQSEYEKYLEQFGLGVFRARINEYAKNINAVIVYLDVKKSEYAKKTLAADDVDKFAVWVERMSREYGVLSRAAETANAIKNKLSEFAAQFEALTEGEVTEREAGDIDEFDNNDLLDQFRRVVQVKQALLPKIAEVYELAQQTRMLVDARGSQEQKNRMSSLFVELVDNIEKLLSGFKRGQVDVKKSMQKLAEDAQKLAKFEENVRKKRVSKESRASLVAYLAYQKKYFPLSKLAPNDVTGWLAYFQEVQQKLEALRLPLLATPAPELKHAIGDVLYQLTLLKGKLQAIMELPYPQTAKNVSRGKIEVLARSAEECIVLWSRIIVGLDKLMVLAKGAGHAELLKNLQVMLQKVLPQDHGKMEVLMTKILSSLGLAAEHALKEVKPHEMADEVNSGLEELFKVHKTFNDAQPIAVLEGIRAVLAIHARGESVFVSPKKSSLARR